ncbi:RND family efflux transporter MFP subunit [Pseudomonas duriflava]|uniref:RND family efflux transporter MFP subunit n=1 Tax=Pseudomonas duriflava TaxID=459528 RepID=A0A562QI18_9PSED|nr:HlyD family secretion protein [Pseudomonas duriflava]TWI55696.1 RND family efflux transporter MFP subunit [Pseudomonas duriflava]
MRKVARVVITIGVVLLAIGAGLWLWRFYMLSPWTRDARIRADVVVVAPDVAGWVTNLAVEDNQLVKKGDLLLEIDRERYQASLAHARAVADTRKQQMHLRESEAARRNRLGTSAISAEDRENARINAAVARSQYQEALTDVRLAELNLARSRVVAPREGRITNLRFAEGNYVRTGEAVMALVDTHSFYVMAYFEETKIPHIHIGDSVSVTLMSHSAPLTGRVASISSGITDSNSSPDEQLLAEVQPTFNWVRLAQRIPVRIELEEVPPNIHLSAGMTASVSVQDAHGHHPLQGWRRVWDY